MTIRPEQDTAEDRVAIYGVNQAAFGRTDESDLVDKLRTEGFTLLSLVADQNDRVIGHILFSRMSIETKAGPVSAVSLAPVAVLPEHQRQGVGGRLIQAGLYCLQEKQERIVIVVGHPDYYPRFGFSRAKAALLKGPFHPEAVMALELIPGALSGVEGHLRYPPPFGL